MAAAGIAGAALLACWPAWWSAGTAARRPGLVATLLVAAAATGLAAVAYPRRHTLWPAFVLVQASCTAYGVLGYPPSPLGYVGLGATGLAAWRERGRWRPALLLVSLAGTALIAVSLPSPPRPAVVAFNAMLVAAAFGIGSWTATRAEETAREALQREHALAEDVAIARIERDEARFALVANLHDRVGNALSVMIRQLEAARRAEPAHRDALVGIVEARLRSTMDDIGSVLAQTSGAVDATAPPACDRPAVGALGTAIGDGVRSLCSYGGAISLHLAGPLTEPMAAAQDHLAAALISECF
ncbi:MAG: hypothetical protein ACYDH5_07335, partial [Acidimicrobiales bacterium]